MKIVSTIIFCFYSLTVLTQQSRIDTLKYKLEQTNTDKQKLIFLSELAQLLDGKESAENGLPIFNKLLELSIKSKNKVLQSKAHNYIAEAYVKLNDSTLAISYAKKSIDIIESTTYVDEHITSMAKLGRVYNRFRNSKSAVEIFEKILRIYTNNKHDSIQPKLVGVYSSLGRAYGDLGDSKKQIDYYLEGARLADKFNDYESKNSINYLIGWIYMDLEQHNKAKKYYLKALEDSINFKASFYSTRIFHALGINYSRAGNFKEALLNNSKALRRYREEGDKLYEFDVINNTAVIYQRKNIPDSIEFYAKQALDVANDLNNKVAINASKNTLSAAYLKQKKYQKAKNLLLEIAQDTLGLNKIDSESKATLFSYLSKAYEGLGQHSKSLKFLNRYLSLNDSLTINLIDTSIADIEIKYQTEKREKENNQLREDKIKQELITQKANSRNWLLGLFSLIAILTLLLFLRYAQSRKRQLLYESQLNIIKAKQNEHEEIGIELHDNISKELEEASLKLIKDGKKELSKTIIVIKNKIRNLSKELSIISFEESPFSDQLITLASNYENDKLKIKLRGLEHISWESTENPIKYNLFLIIREAVSNCANYAKANNLIISFEKVKKDIIIKIKDDGIGFDKNEINHGRGFRNMKIRAKDMNGELKIESQKNKGTNIFIQLILA